MTGKSADPGFTLHNGADPAMPVLIAVPHAGRDYPAEIFANLRLPPASLVRLEDRYADLLARDAVAAGLPVMVANRARAWIDLNRSEQDIDAEMVRGLDRHHLPSPGAKQRGGLGLIPRRLSGEGDIWKAPMDMAHVDARIVGFHRPYHHQLSAILEKMHARFGVAVLLDLHSMPPLGSNHGSPPPRFVVGDRFGRSAANRFAETVVAQIRLHGHAVALNHPYSGDHILRTHGRADRNIHALQLEVDRSLYLDELLREPSADVSRIAQLVTSLAAALADQATGGDMAIAAE